VGQKSYEQVSNSPADFVDWLSVERFEGREYDIAINRRWLDPMRPFAATVLQPAHGALITSATLRDGEDWASADARTGAAQAHSVLTHFAAASPFDYARQAQILIVTDIKRGDLAGLAHAYAQLIEASGGGALGLFTAIRRLRLVHARIADHLSAVGLPLYAQHVDPIDTGTLVDIFRADPHTSLLGTDALRDGVDVPGESLKLVIMEGVPWLKPSILHAARRAAFGGNAYAEQQVRARLAQAFGRLIRRANDRGTFVILSAAMPSRLLSAFPPQAPVHRVTLDEAIALIKNSHAPLPSESSLVQDVPL
jgi:ATP-dependent DNA helicase DinG